jgi:ATP-binding cassette subfamily B protein
MSFSLYAQVLRFVWSYWWQAPRVLVVLVALRVVSSLVDVATPFAAGHLVDIVVGAPGREAGAAFEALAILLVLVLVFQALRGGLDFILIRFSSSNMARLVRDAFARVQHFSSDWHANTFAGATVRKVTRGMWAFDRFTDTMIFSLVPALVVVTAVSAVFLVRWPLLGLAVTLAILAYLAVSIGLSVAWVGPATQLAQAYDSRLSANLADTIGANQVIKAFAAEGREDKRFARLLRAWKARARISWGRGAATGLAQAAVLIVMQATMLGMGLMLWVDGRASPGDVATLVSTQLLISGYLRDIGQHVRNAQQALHEMEDVALFSRTEPHIGDAPGAKPLMVGRGRIRFNEVTFGYAAAGRSLYDHFSLDIEPGEKIGLVGASGSGKSTFVKLLQRLYDLDSGEIRIDGQDIAKVTQESLRRAIGVVPQEALLFHRSLAENIAYGRPEAPLSAIREAAALAHADRFIEQLPKTYRTPVGERGVKLSGGERQRVAIARAILAATPILILDEATSSLDSISEALIRDAIAHLSEGRTTIVVAHRLSTVQSLDRILVFDAGRIVEEGRHAELLRRENGLYRRLFETQAGKTPILV